MLATLVLKKGSSIFKADLIHSAIISSTQFLPIFRLTAFPFLFCRVIISLSKHIVAQGPCLAFDLVRPKTAARFQRPFCRNPLLPSSLHGPLLSSFVLSFHAPQLGATLRSACLIDSLLIRLNLFARPARYSDFPSKEMD